MAKLIYIFLGVFKMKQKTEQNIISNSFNKQPALPPKWFNKTSSSITNQHKKQTCLANNTKKQPQQACYFIFTRWCLYG